MALTEKRIADMEFWKINGNGNDFIVIDGTSPDISGLLWPQVARSLCRRRSSIGADGILVALSSREAHFTMKIFNSDGSEGEMCGNGARCMARYAAERHMAPSKMVFETLAGLIHAEVTGSWVDIDMGRAEIHQAWLDRQLTLDGETFRSLFATVGVPHLVLWGQDVVSRDFARLWGRRLCHDESQFPQGANVTFATPVARGEVQAVTFERGVEDLTDSCGTGCIATALTAHLLAGMDVHIEVHNPGGTNRIALRHDSDLYAATLGGATAIVARGHTGPDVKF